MNRRPSGFIAVHNQRPAHPLQQPIIRMTFPTWLELAAKNLPTTIGLLLVTSAVYWRFFARRRIAATARGKHPTGGLERWQGNASLAGYLLLTSAMVFAFNYPVLQAMRYAAVLAASGASDPDALPANLAEIHVQRLHPLRQTPLGDPIIVRDAANLQSVRAALKQATPRPRIHESFTIGYRLTFRLKNSDAMLDAYLLAFQHSSTHGPVQVVIPKMGRAGIDVYNSATLHEWIGGIVE